jgi:hypothetical protein
MRSLLRLFAPLPVIFTALAACTSSSSDDNPATAPLLVSGSRLHVMYLQGPDGLRIPTGWMDTKRNETCRFTTAEDGVRRCMPSAGSYGTTYFADAACTKPIARVRKPCDAGDEQPKYAFEPVTGTTCESKNKIYALGAKLPADTPIYFAGNGPNGCFSTTGSPDEEAYERGALIAPTEFVAAADSAGPEKGGSRLALGYRTAEDGSKEVDRLYDTSSGKGCNFRTAADGEIRCLPNQDSAFTTYFSDAACTAPLFVDDNACAKEPATSILATLGTECPRRTHVFAKGPAAPVSPIYSVSSGVKGCQPAQGSTNPGVSAYGAGPEVAASTFARVTTTKIGSGRLAREAYKPDDGPVIADDDLYDTKNDVYGSFTRVDAKTARFLPRGLSVTTYADPACTQPIATSYDYDGCPPEHAPKYATEYVPGAAGCRSSVKVYRLGATITPDKMYDSYSGSCRLHATSTSSVETYYAVAEEIPADQWPTATLEVE